MVRGALFALALVAVSLSAGEVAIVDAGIRASGNDRYSVYASVRHDDTGWDHYANKWELIGDDGRIYGTRILQHPHVHEQPVARALFNIYLPTSVEQLTLRAYDSVHGAGGEWSLKIPGRRPAN